MTLRLARAEPQHVGEIARVCFEAFKEIDDRHGFPRGFPTLDSALKVVGMMVEREDFYGVVALIDNKPVGSNFMSVMDQVAGIGPITIDPAYQGKNVGRALMEDVINYAHHNGINRIRLVQASDNVTSLSLFASLGFDVKETIVRMQAVPAANLDDSVRPIRGPDLTEIEALSKHIYKVSRRNEVAAVSSYGFSAFLRERDGRMVGYFIPGLFGHGMAETIEDALVLIGESARQLQPEAVHFFCPLREANFYRSALKAGCKTLRVANLMAMGPYEPPNRAWMPSVLY